VAEADSTETVRKLTNELGELRKLMADRVANDQVREKAFDHLYEELRQYKEDFLFQAEKPLLLDLLLFYDSLNWFQESLVKQDMSADVIADSFQYLIDEFLELLYRRDVVPIEQAEVFDRKVHKAVKVEETDDAQQDYRIHQILKRGFARSERLLRPEEVVISRLRKKKKAGE
jgi:molecular chaperone GrpE (heat shock protein)